MQITIQSNGYSAAVDTLGAELVSFKGKDGFEHLWQGDKTYWGGHAPVLFPIVGALRGGKVRIKGEWYEMGRHGFARRREFTVTSQTENAVTLVLNSDGETKKQYPYDFRFTVTYTLNGATLETAFTAENTGAEKLPFCVGGHPGFNIPVAEGEVFEDYDIVFEKPETQRCPEIDLAECLIDFNKVTYTLENETTIPLQHHLFYRDALVFQNTNSASVAVKSRKSGRGVEMDFSEFPMLGIWSAANDGPYVALEPWTGCATGVDEDDEFLSKRGMKELEPGGKETHAFRVTIL